MRLTAPTLPRPGTFRLGALRLGTALAVLGWSLPAGAEEVKGGMPQLDPTGYPPQLIWLAITFILLYLLCWKVLLPRVGTVLEARSNQIGNDLTSAERLKKDVEAAIAEYSAAEARAQGEAQRLASETRERLTGKAASARAALDAKLGEEARVAEAEILRLKQGVLANLNAIAATTTQAIVRRLGAVEIGTEDATAAVAKAAEGKR